MNKYDVTIVGAGPSGAYTAYLLAKAGIDVLIVDKGLFPRCKPCAGGLTAKTFTTFDFSIDEFVKYTANSVIASYKNQVFHRISGEKVITKMVDRPEFDHFLINKAVEAGAEFLDGTKVKTVLWKDGEFCVSTEESTFWCKYLIGADGSNSVVNKTFGIVEKDFYGFAVETTCPVNENDIYKFEMTFDFGTVPNGYLWIFPKGHHLCIGAYTANKKLKIKAYLSDYIKELGLSTKPDERFRGHIIPFYGINYRQPDFPCILVGDAAGFGDYFTGEGIYYAVKSGIIAAEVIISSIKSGAFQYEELQKRYNLEIIEGLKLAYLIGKAFYKRLPYTYDIFMSYFPASVLYEGTSRGFTYDAFISKSPVLLQSIVSNKSKISDKKYYN